MPIVKCRDCGADSDEHPNDPAPRLCAPCYKTRMDRITPAFNRVMEELQNPLLACDWLRGALVDIGGETPEYANRHANALLRALIYGTPPDEYEPPAY